MNYRKMTGSGRRYNAEYPVFTPDDGEDADLMNAFSEKLVSLVKRRAEEGMRRYRLTFSLEETEKGLSVTFFLRVSENRKTVSSASIRTLWKDGFIKKYENHSETC